jgi:hypothetical protein
MQRFHDLLNASLADEEIGQLPPQTLSSLRRDLERLPALRALLQQERQRRRDVLRGARVLQRTSGCLDDERAIRAA